MGQTLSEQSHTANSSGRTKWKADTARRLNIRGYRSKEKRGGEHINRNPMKNKVLSCLGRRKRDSSQAEADSGSENVAGDPATLRDHRVGKLPRDDVVSTTGELRSSSSCLGGSSGVETKSIQQRVNRGTAAGPSDARGLETLTVEVCVAGCDEPKHELKDNASYPPTRAMEDQPLERNGQDCVVSEATDLLGTTLSSDPRSTLDPHTECTSSSLASDQPLGGELSVSGNHADAKMTKTDSSTMSCPYIGPGGQNTCSVEIERRKDSDQTHHGPSGGQSYPGTIPKLIITRDPSPTRCQEPPALLSARTELTTGSCLDCHPDDESPCSDSGCGGSPALMRSPRKLSNSSSIGLSSASSFEESEDDFTGSDIESSLSPARSLCSPDDGPGVGVFLPPSETFSLNYLS